MKSVKNQKGFSDFDIIKKVIFSYQKLIFDTKKCILEDEIF